jgi:hypothetical protein
MPIAFVRNPGFVLRHGFGMLRHTFRGSTVKTFLRLGGGVDGISAVQSPTGSGKVLSVREFSQAFVFIPVDL